MSLIRDYFHNSLESAMHAHNVLYVIQRGVGIRGLWDPDLAGETVTLWRVEGESLCPKR